MVNRSVAEVELLMMVVEGKFNLQRYHALWSVEVAVRRTSNTSQDRVCQSIQ